MTAQPKNTEGLELWKHAEFVAGHTAGVAWWNAMKPGVECPQPQNPYTDTWQRILWDRGFEWGADDACDSFYTID